MSGPSPLSLLATFGVLAVFPLIRGNLPQWTPCACGAPPGMEIQALSSLFP
jgi:hypothetical protein